MSPVVKKEFEFKKILKKNTGGGSRVAATMWTLNARSDDHTVTMDGEDILYIYISAKNGVFS